MPLKQWEGGTSTVIGMLPPAVVEIRGCPVVWLRAMKINSDLVVLLTQSFIKSSSTV